MTGIMLRKPPTSWPVYRIGQVFRERKATVSDNDYQPLSVTKSGIVPQLETAAKTDDGDNRKLVMAGDFVINSRSDRKGSSGVSDRSGSVSLISIVLEPLGIEGRFAHHLLRSTAFQEEFYRFGHGIVADLWTTRYAEMKNIRLALPDLATQKAIATFLDAETARIDALIEKKQSLADVLVVRRARVILDALSRRGAPEILQSPEAYHTGVRSDGWSVRRIKHIVSFMTSGSRGWSEYLTDDGEVFMQAAT